MYRSRYVTVVLSRRSAPSKGRSIGRLTLFANSRSGAHTLTALGNWRATALFWKPQVALFVNEATLLPVLMPLAPAKSIADRFPGHLETVLDALGTDRRFVAVEIEAPTDARWARTANRSIVGMMNEFSFLAETDRAHERGEDLVSMAVRLAGTPCSPLYKRNTFPVRERRPRRFTPARMNHSVGAHGYLWSVLRSTQE